MLPSLTSRRLEFGVIVGLSFGERCWRAGLDFARALAGWFYVGVLGCIG